MGGRDVLLPARHESARLSLSSSPSSMVAGLSEFDLCIEAPEVIGDIARDQQGRPRGYRLFRNWTRSVFSWVSSPSPKQLL